MIYTLIILLLALTFLLLKIKTKRNSCSERTKKVTTILTRIVMLSPLFGIIIFAVLLTTLLKGRLMERSSHALIVFVLWMYATSFYIEFLRHFKNKTIVIISMIGMVLSVSLAIILTPLDRYCDVLYSFLNGFTYCLSIFAIAFLYIGHFIANKPHK